MKHPTLMPWTKKLTLLATAVALIALMCAVLITTQVQAQEVTTFVSNASETSSTSTTGRKPRASGPAQALTATRSPRSRFT